MKAQTMETKVFTFPPEQKRICWIVLCIAGIVLGLAFAGIIGSATRAWANVFLNSIYFLSLGVCGIFFVALHHLTGARWSEVIRKIPEAMSYFIPIGSLLMVCNLFGMSHLFAWTQGHGHAVVAHADHGKSFYLSMGFFSVRMVVILGLWIWFFVRFKNVSQRSEQGLASNHENGLSARFMIVFALTFAMASFDWLMSLEHHWFSTVFAIYHFSGVFVSGLAVISIIAITLRDLNLLKELNENHVHDLGKYLFAFSLFWAYIWFCQFMLIWYGNIPEETVYYAHRLKGDWAWLFYFNVFINFVVPFFILLSRKSKRNPALVFRVAIVLLIGHWLDLYLMIMPPVTGPQSNIGSLEVMCALGFAAAFTLTVGHALEKSPILPRPSALLTESLHYHQ